MQTLSTHDVVRGLLRQGWAPIPVPAGPKKATIEAWQDLRVTEATIAAHFSEGDNIGLLLGPASGNLADVDLDAAEAVAIGRGWLPRRLASTGMVHGRSGKRFSHWFYTVR